MRRHMLFLVFSTIALANIWVPRPFADDEAGDMIEWTPLPGAEASDPAGASDARSEASGTSIAPSQRHIGLDTLPPSPWSCEGEYGPTPWSEGSDFWDDELRWDPRTLQQGAGGTTGQRGAVARALMVDRQQLECIRDSVISLLEIMSNDQLMTLSLESCLE